MLLETILFETNILTTIVALNGKHVQRFFICYLSCPVVLVIGCGKET